MDRINDREPINTSKADFDSSADRDSKIKESLEKGRAIPKNNLDFTPDGYQKTIIDKAVEKRREEKIKRIERHDNKRDPEQKLSRDFSRSSRGR